MSLLLLLTLAAPQSIGADPIEAAAPRGGPLAETRLALPADGSRLALRDLDGDGDLELVRVDRRGLAVRNLTDEGLYGAAEAFLAWPDPRVSWDLVDFDGDGRTELLAVVGGRRVEVFEWRGPDIPGAPGAWTDPELLLEEACYLPWGVTRVGLTRDVDGDGRLDLVLPGPGVFRIRLNQGGGEGPLFPAEDPIEVVFEPEVSVDLGDPERLSSMFSQSVRVPWFSVRDVDGDGRLDVVSETEDEVAFHLARPKIDANPTWTLDLAALRGEDDGPDIDLDDLLSVVSGTAQWRVADLDGEAPNDLVVGARGTFKVYFGGSASGPRARADQVLKASGNVLYFFLRDVVGGDGRLDLQIARGERLSLARLLRFLLIPGQIEFELFTYGNRGAAGKEDGIFERRATQSSTLALRVPRLLGFIDDFDALSEELEQQWDVPARRVDWDGDGAADDVIDQRGGRLALVRNCAPERQRWEDLPATDLDGLVERVILQDLDRAGDGGTSVIDLGELDQFAMAPGAALRELAAKREPTLEHPLWGVTKERAMRALDLDGDGRADLLAAGKDEQNIWRVQLLVRR